MKQQIFILQKVMKLINILTHSKGEKVEYKTSNNVKANAAAWDKYADAELQHRCRTCVHVCDKYKGWYATQLTEKTHNSNTLLVSKYLLADDVNTLNV